MAETQKIQSEGRGQQAQALSSQQQRQSGSEELTRKGDLFPFLYRPSDLFGMSPFAAMRRMMQDMDRMFTSNWPGSQMQGEPQTWLPPVEVSEQEGNLLIRADLPGLSKDDVKVELTDEGLVLRGERKREHEERKGQMYRSERSYGSFFRCIPLPEGAKAEQAKAQFNNGVLEVKIPVPEEHQRRREIPIQTGSSESQQRQLKS